MDLNSLLYKYETDFAELIETQFGGKLPGVSGESGDAKFWRQRAAARKTAMMALMWDDQRGYFFDYDFVNHRRSTYISATGLCPLWAKMLDRKQSGRNETRQTHRRLSPVRSWSNPPGFRRRPGNPSSLRADTMRGNGIIPTAGRRTRCSRGRDSRITASTPTPGGWRIAGFICIAKNAHDYNGVIPEKYNVVTGSHEVFVEYGNVGHEIFLHRAGGFRLDERVI